MLFSEPKIPQCDALHQRLSRRAVSVLFSEPKIPQPHRDARSVPAAVFQCSSASRKFLNVVLPAAFAYFTCFSALQRAENSSICGSKSAFTLNPTPFQCSSASRKFLKDTSRASGLMDLCFSALQRAENSSTRGWISSRRRFTSFSALQRAENSSTRYEFRQSVSSVGFSALQRAENSSICVRRLGCCEGVVSVLFSEPKIPQCGASCMTPVILTVSVLFSEPKIPQSDPRTCVHPYSRLRRSRFVVPEPSWCVAMTPVY